MGPVLVRKASRCAREEDTGIPSIMTVWMGGGGGLVIGMGDGCTNGEVVWAGVCRAGEGGEGWVRGGGVVWRAL